MVFCLLPLCKSINFWCSCEQLLTSNRGSVASMARLAFIKKLTEPGLDYWRTSPLISRSIDMF